MIMLGAMHEPEGSRATPGQGEGERPRRRRLPLGATVLLLVLIALFVLLVDWAGEQLGLGAEPAPPAGEPSAAPR